MSASQFWVLQRGPGAAGRGGAPLYSIVESAGSPKTAIGVTVAAGPFATKAKAQAWINAQGQLHLPSLPGLSGVDAIGHFFANLTDRATVIRIAEVLLGMGLLLVGGLALVKDTSAGQVIVDNLKKAGMTAAMLPK